MDPKNPSYPFTVSIFGDLGTEYSNGTITQLNYLAVNNKLDLLVHAGDISYVTKKSEQT